MAPAIAFAKGQTSAKKITKNTKLTLDIIKDIGGKKDDLKLLKDLDDTRKSITNDSEEDDDEKALEDEVANYLQGLQSKSANKSSTSKKIKIKNKFKPEKEVPSENPGATIKKERLPPAKKNVTLSSIIEEHKPRSSMVIKPGGKWSDHQFKNDPLAPDRSSVEVKGLLPQLEHYSANLMKEDVSLYKKHQASRKKRADFQWIQTVLTSGTVADRMAAMIVLVQESPVHNLTTLHNLISMVNVKAKRECIMAAETLRDLFISDLLLTNRKLRKFEQHPFEHLVELSGGNKDTIDKHLILWYFEAQLKKCYVEFLGGLESLSRDSIEVTKNKAVSIMYELLVSNSEQEQILLAKIVNKLGDPLHKVAARCAQKMNLLVNRHPNMKMVVAMEVERLLFRPNIGQRAQYYGICFLNQLLLSHEESELAARLIGIYFGFFKMCVKKDEVDTKLMSALLTGVNRAYPFAKKNTEKLEEQIDTMYKVVHAVSFNISVQALMLIYQILDAKQAISDRYYSALYRKILDPELNHSSRQAMFLNLIFKALRKDNNKRRMQAFVKRLLQVAFQQPPGVVCGILFLISEVLKEKAGIVTVERKASLYLEEDDQEEHFVDVDKDAQIDDCPAASANQSKKKNGAHHLDPVPNEEKCLATVNQLGTAQQGPSWHHQKNSSDRDKLYCLDGGYSPHHRNPSYAGAEHTCAWELLALSAHYHPSVALFAQAILSNDHITYPGDPLQDFTLIRFLDRFVFRNPKKVSTSSSSDAKLSVLGRRKLYVPRGAKQIPVNSKQYTQRKERMVPADETFLFRYFSQYSDMYKQRRKKPEDDSDVESVNSDEFEQLLTKFEPGDLRSEYDMDFAGEFANQKKKKRGRKGEEQDDDSDIGSLNDDEDDFENDAEFQDAFKDFDEELADVGNMSAFDDDTFVGMSDPSEAAGSRLKRKHETKFSLDKKKFKKNIDSADPDTSGLFAAAEEFSAVIDENVSSTVDTTTANALANKDNADVKQLKWEVARDQWVRNTDWKSRKRRKAPNKDVKFRSKNTQRQKKPDKRNMKRARK